VITCDTRQMHDGSVLTNQNHGIVAEMDFTNPSLSSYGFGQKLLADILG
jgi:hypothetical protein